MVGLVWGAMGRGQGPMGMKDEIVMYNQAGLTFFHYRYRNSSNGTHLHEIADIHIHQNSTPIALT